MQHQAGDEVEHHYNVRQEASSTSLGLQMARRAFCYENCGYNIDPDTINTISSKPL
jgi:hypothetical protein